MITLTLRSVVSLLYDPLDKQFPQFSAHCVRAMCIDDAYTSPSASSSFKWAHSCAAPADSCRFWNGHWIGTQSKKRGNALCHRKALPLFSGWVASAQPRYWDVEAWDEGKSETADKNAGENSADSGTTTKSIGGSKKRSARGHRNVAWSARKRDRPCRGKGTESLQYFQKVWGEYRGYKNHQQTQFRSIVDQSKIMDSQ